MDITSLLGGVSIGQDTSGNFKLSFNGLAVKTPDERFVAYVRDKDKANDHLLDVTDLIIDGSDTLIYRVPAKTVKRGDLIVTSDTPFVAYFVAEDGDTTGKISVLDPQNSTSTEYSQPANLFQIRFFVKAFSPIPVGKLGLGTLGGGDLDDKLLPLVLLSDKTDDSMTKLLLLQALGGKSLGGKGLESSNLLLLSLLNKGGQSDMLQTLLLTQAFEGEEEKEEHAPETATAKDPDYKQIQDTTHAHKHQGHGQGPHYHTHSHQGGEVDHHHNVDYTLHEQNKEHVAKHHDPFV